SYGDDDPVLDSDPSGLDPHCTMHYDPKEPHIRTARGRHEVGAKPITTCKRSVRWIEITTQMQKHSWFWGWENVDHSFTEKSKGNVAKFQQKNVAVQCTNSKETNWRSEATGEAKAKDGDIYSTPNPAIGGPRELKCG